MSTETVGTASLRDTGVAAAVTVLGCGALWTGVSAYEGEANIRIDALFAALLITGALAVAGLAVIARVGGAAVQRSRVLAGVGSVGDYLVVAALLMLAVFAGLLAVASPMPWWAHVVSGAGALLCGATAVRHVRRSQ